MKTQDQSENLDVCPQTQVAPGYLLDELSQEERRTFESHMATCLACKHAVETFRSVIQRMQQVPKEVSRRDLAPLVLARVSAGEKAPVPLPFWRAPLVALAQIAAAILIVAALSSLVVVNVRHGHTNIQRKHETAVTPAVPSSLAALEGARGWLQRAQGNDGNWTAGQTDHGIGVSALALLALMNGNPDVFHGPYATTVRKGIGYLVDNQDAQGLIGPRVQAAPYNQGMATLAILSACALESNAVWRAAGEKALAFIASAQLPSGGWGYLQSTPGPANTSASIWPLQALIRGDELGVSGLRPHIDRGLAWLQSAVDRDGFMGYTRADDFPYGQDTMTAAGIVCFIKDNKGSPHPAVRALLPALRRIATKLEAKTDFYRLFFVAQAAGLADDEQGRRTLSAIAGKLASLQNGSGAAAGSWDANDQWGRVGGPVYSTAMAALALKCD